MSESLAKLNSKERDCCQPPQGKISRWDKPLTEIFNTFATLTGSSQNKAELLARAKLLYQTLSVYDYHPSDQIKKKDQKKGSVKYLLNPETIMYEMEREYFHIETLLLLDRLIKSGDDASKKRLVEVWRCQNAPW